MASTTKKYVSVDEQNVVQNEMKFPSENLKVETGSEYRKIDEVFLKGVQIQGETTSLTPVNGIVTIPKPPEPITDYVKSVVLKGGTPEGEETPSQIVSEMKGDGTAVLDVSEIEFGDIEVDSLTIGGKEISQLIPNMQGLNGIEKLGETHTHNDVVDKLNALIEILKGIAEAQQLPSSGTGN